MYESDSSRMDKNKDVVLVESKNILDQWIIARLTQLNVEVTNGLDSYKFFEPSRAIRDFIADLSQWYLRRSRDRFKIEGEEKEQALNVTRYVLITLAKMMAPLTPFFAEELYRELDGYAESVHLEAWPIMKNPDLKVIEIMKIVREVSSKGLEARMNAKVNVRQPLAELRIKEKLSIKDYDDALEIIKDEVNVKRIVFDEIISNDVELDLNITPELKEEGMVRELIRLIQDLRKEKGFTVNDKAILKIDTDEEGKSFVEKNKTYISSVAQLDDIKYSKFEGEFIEISGLKIKITI
jgi:isoleucyl-tRNA synthetase